MIELRIRFEVSEYSSTGPEQTMYVHVAPRLEKPFATVVGPGQSSSQLDADVLRFCIVSNWPSLIIVTDIYFVPPLF